MTNVIFNPALFREQYPAFQCTPPASDSVLQGYFDMATAYISNRNCRNYCYLGRMSLAQQTQALYLMTAHLGTIARSVYNNDAIGVMTQATVDKVSVTLEPPPALNQWQYWLNSTPYGQQLLALLQVISVGGYFVGGRPELAAFRRAGWN
jgi:hypothetical protein